MIDEMDIIGQLALLGLSPKSKENDEPNFAKGGISLGSDIDKIV